MAWSDPVDSAYFQIRLPRHLGPAEISYPVTEIRENGSDRVYEIRLSKLRTRRDVEIGWCPGGVADRSTRRG